MSKKRTNGTDQTKALARAKAIAADRRAELSPHQVNVARELFWHNVIREMLTGGHVIPDQSISQSTFGLLFAADRLDHCQREVEPQLAAGAIVLCDRFSDSTIAYQGYGHGQDLARVRRWDAESRPGLEPDLTLLLDCPIALGAERRHREVDRYQVLDRAFHERVRRGFLDQAAAAPTRIHTIDGSRDLALVSAEVAQVTLGWLAAHGVAPTAARASV